MKIYLTILSLLGVSYAALQADSLWNRNCVNSRGMFASRVAAQVGDILTVSVDEETIQENELKTVHNKSASIVGAVTSYLFPSSGFGKHNGEFPSTNIGLSNDDYSGGGSIKNKAKLTTTFSVRVVDVLPNRNLVIRGRRVINFSKEKEFAVLSGVVRPEDITAGNTIASTLIGDLDVAFYKEGEISASQKKGWLLKLKDAINPF